MATTVAHGLIGAASYVGLVCLLPKNKRLPLGFTVLIIAALAANIPDMDLIANLLLPGGHQVQHGGVTHSFFFAALVALLVGLATHKRRWCSSAAIGVFTVISSHILVDWFTGPDPGLHPTRGLALLWPLADARLPAPITVFQGVNHSALLPGALYTALWELLLLGPATAAIIYAARRSSGRNPYA